MPTITGTSGDDVLTGTDGPDTIYGGDGNDTIDAGASGSIGDYIDDGAGNDIVHGGPDQDYIVCSPGDDLYDGGTGATTFGIDFDTVDYSAALAGINVDLTRTDYQVWSSGTGDAANIGHDQLQNIEGIDGSAFDDVITGDASDNDFRGGAGNDTLKGGDGNDVLLGGSGDDILDGGAGTDVADFGLASSGVHVSLAVTGPQDTGEGIDTLINIESVNGTSFSDVLTGDAGDNVLDGELGGDDHLYGGAGADELAGSRTGNNLLDGGTGADTMDGFDGSDTYIVDNVGDHVQDWGDDDIPGHGVDTVRASVSYTLQVGFGIEDLVLTGSAAISGTGNELDNKITGNAANNQLFGNAGNDILNGGAGIDRMSGGTGNDTYYVDAYGDKVIENAGEGTDSVFASASYKLSDNIERLTLAGTANIYGYGNDLDNVVTGNSGINKLFGMGGNDTLDGKGGADLMTGGAGDDRYYVDSYGDRVIENSGEGIDSVFANADYKLAANIEKLTLTGSADIWGYGNDLDNGLTGNDGANKLYGLAGSDTIKGGGGNDWIEGGAGKDVMTGGAGSDSFVFRDGDFGGATGATADRIVDFSQGEDRIHLNYVDANTALSGDQAFHFIGTSAFDGTAGELRYQEIGGSTFISGDTNGDGTADFMIRVDGLHTLTTSDFTL